jgi:hypothetical protein
MSNSVSGLSVKHRIRARDLAVQAAILTLHHAPQVHYTQAPVRWEGIAKNMKAFRQSYPKQCDCSSFATWCLWNGLDHYGVRDTVNDHGWHSGYTGTMVANGRKVSDTGSVLRGDLVLYGNPFGSTGHVAVVAGRGRDGQLMVISHGSEGGPFYLAYDYRRDIHSIRRYI